MPDNETPELPELPAFRTSQEADIYLRALVEEMEDLSNKEDLNGEETTRWAIIVPLAERTQQVKANLADREARVQRLTEEARAGVTSGRLRTESGEDTGRGLEVMVKPSKDEVFDTTTIRSNMFSSPDAIRTELRDRGMRAIEANDRRLGDAGKEDIERLLELRTPGEIPGQTVGQEAAMHLLRTGSDNYHSAFFHYMRTGEAQELRSAMNESGYPVFGNSGGAGGYLVPFTLDPTIILSNAGAENPFRTIARNVQITSPAWHGISSAGVTAEWTAEAAQAADASPTVSNTTINTHKADAYVQASIELIQDTGIDNQIATLLADAKDRLESTAFAVGSGDANNQPYGIVTELQLVTASRISGSSSTGSIESNATLALADIYALSSGLSARWQKNATWVAHRTVWNTLRQVISGANGGYNQNTFWTDFGGGMPPSLIGYPAYTSNAMDSTIVSGSSDDVIILGDFNQYVIADRIGMSILYNPLVVSTSNNRPTFEVGYAAFWRVGARAHIPDAFRMLRL